MIILVLSVAQKMLESFKEVTEQVVSRGFLWTVALSTLVCNHSIIFSFDGTTANLITLKFAFYTVCHLIYNLGISPLRAYPGRSYGQFPAFRMEFASCVVEAILRF